MSGELLVARQWFADHGNSDGGRGCHALFFGQGHRLVRVSLRTAIPLASGEWIRRTVLRLAVREVALTVGIMLVVAGFTGAIYPRFGWEQLSSDALVPNEIMRTPVLSVTLIATGIPPVFDSVLLGFIEMEGRDLPADITA